MLQFRGKVIYRYFYLKYLRCYDRFNCWLERKNIHVAQGPISCEDGRKCVRPYMIVLFLTLNY
jgi:hypothetical protein